MEGQCKNSLGYLRLAATYDRTTKSLVEGFLEEAVKEMVGLRVVMDVATDLFLELLTWLGIPASRHSDYTPARLASILNKFSRLDTSVTPSLGQHYFSSGNLTRPGSSWQSRKKRKEEKGE